MIWFVSKHDFENAVDVLPLKSIGIEKKGLRIKVLPLKCFGKLLVSESNQPSQKVLLVSQVVLFSRFDPMTVTRETLAFMSGRVPIIAILWFVSSI